MITHTPILTEVTHFRKIGNSMYIGIPKRIREALAWTDGEALMIRSHKNKVLVMSIHKDMFARFQAQEPKLATTS